MSNAKNDGNHNPTIILASSADGLTIVPAQANPTTHYLHTDDGIGGTDNGNNNGIAMHDQNGNAVWTALSSVGDGSIVEIYGDPATGEVLIDRL